MARKNHNPGCPCCEVIEACYDETFTDDYSSFTNADGSFSVDRWTVASGDNITSAAVPIGAAAWFHTVHIKSGDCDLTWDGITFEYRDAGTITNGTNSSIFMPGSVPPAGWEETAAIRGTYITLWVTPDWYCVMVNRNRAISGFDTNTRGSVQVITRDNTSAPKSMVVTAVAGALEIASWRIADATVTAERECAKPTRHPQCTERYFQSQQALLTALTWTHTIDRYEIVDGPPGDPAVCQYLETVASGVTLRIGSTPVTAWPDNGACFILFTFLIPSVPGSLQPNPETSIALSQNYKTLVSTPGDPYPKPAARFAAALQADVFGGTDPCDRTEVSSAQTDVIFGTDGKAPVMFSGSLLGLDANYFSCHTLTSCAAGKVPIFSEPTRVTTDVPFDWDAE